MANAVNMTILESSRQVMRQRRLESITRRRMNANCSKSRGIKSYLELKLTSHAAQLRRENNRSRIKVSPYPHAMHFKRL